jgi:hypothetical protein
MLADIVTAGRVTPAVMTPRKLSMHVHANTKGV